MIAKEEDIGRASIRGRMAATSICWRRCSSGLRRARRGRTVIGNDLLGFGTVPGPGQGTVRGIPNGPGPAAEAGAHALGSEQPGAALQRGGCWSKVRRHPSDARPEPPSVSPLPTRSGRQWSVQGPGGSSLRGVSGSGPPGAMGIGMGRRDATGPHQCSHSAGQPGGRERNGTILQEN